MTKIHALLLLTGISILAACIQCKASTFDEAYGIAAAFTQGRVDARIIMSDVKYHQQCSPRATVELWESSTYYVSSCSAVGTLVTMLVRL